MADHLKTPTKLTDRVLAFCREIEPEQSPVYIDVDRAPGALQGECFGTVAAAVKAKGGNTQHGWLILEWPDTYLEAQFHAVWIRPDGSLLDVSTPDESRALFLPSTHLKYEGQRTPSKQRAIGDAPEIEAFIDACQELFKFEVSHWFDDGTRVGISTKSPEDDATYQRLEDNRMLATVELYRRLGLLPR